MTYTTVSATFSSTSRYNLDKALNRLNPYVINYSDALFTSNKNVWYVTVTWYCEQANPVEKVQDCIDIDALNSLNIEVNQVFTPGCFSGRGLI